MWRECLGLVAMSAWMLVAWNICIAFPAGIYWHFLDPYNLGISLPPIIVLVLSIVAQLLLDWPCIRTALTQRAELVGMIPPILYAISAVPNVMVRSTCLTLSWAALGWSLVGFLGPQSAWNEHGIWTLPFA